MGEGPTAIRAAVLTVSDSRTAEDDVSGRELEALLRSAGAEVVAYSIVADDLTLLRENLYSLAVSGEVDIILTTGGTGFGPRDNTPEATRSVIDREAPGIVEAMRRETAAATPFAMLSRAAAGIRGSTLIVNLPGSPKGVRECFEVLRPVLSHAVELLRGSGGHH